VDSSRKDKVKQIHSINTAYHLAETLPTPITSKFQYKFSIFSVCYLSIGQESLNNFQRLWVEIKSNTPEGSKQRADRLLARMTELRERPGAVLWL